MLQPQRRNVLLPLLSFGAVMLAALACSSDPASAETPGSDTRTNALPDSTEASTSTAPPRPGADSGHEHRNDAATGAPADGELVRVQLPTPSRRGDLSLEEVLDTRRSVRRYTEDVPSLEALGQLLWATQGITDTDRGYRTAPSAGARFPLEVDIAVANVDGLPDGVLRYHPADHALTLRLEGDRRPDIVDASTSQETLGGAPVLFILSAVPARTAERYGDRAERYVALETGHAAQNLLLQAVSLGLGAVVVGAFNDDDLRSALDLRHDTVPGYVIPVGVPAAP